MSECLSIVPARLCADLHLAGLQSAGVVYLAWDNRNQALQVVQWSRVRWVCSCRRRGCEHVLAVNEYVLAAQI